MNRLSCLRACGIFPDQGLNLGPLHWQVPTPCFLCSSQGSLCLTCCYLRAFALGAPSALNTFFRVPQLAHFLQSPFREALPDHLPLCTLLQHFLSRFPSLLYFSPVTSFFCLPLQNIHPVRGQELCFIHCCIPSAENGDWHEGSDLPLPETSGEGLCP